MVQKKKTYINESESESNIGDTAIFIHFLGGGFNPTHLKNYAQVKLESWTLKKSGWKFQKCLKTST